MRSLDGRVRSSADVHGTSALLPLRWEGPAMRPGGVGSNEQGWSGRRRGHLTLLPGGAEVLVPRRPVRARDLAPHPVRLPDPSSHSDARTLRLTRRGRRVVNLMGVGTAGAVVCLLMSAGLLNDPAAPPVVPRPLVTLQRPAVGTMEITVGPGESLWLVAARVAPGVDRVEAMAALREANHLTSAQLRAGQALRVPASLVG